MVIPQRYLAVNWADGMKVNKDHFIDTENFFVDQIRDTASLLIHAHNFGVLPPLPGGKAVLSGFTASQSASRQLEIAIHHFHAITPGGVRIHIADDPVTATFRLSELEETEAAALNLEEASYLYVVLRVHLYERSPEGNPDPEEIPIRAPYTRPTYEIQLVAENSLNFTQLGAYHLIIGRLRKEGSDLSKDEQFIPPAVTILSQEQLRKYYLNILEQLADVQSYAQQIIQKINFKNQKSPIALQVRQLCEVLLNYCSATYFTIRNSIPQQSPVCLVDLMAQLGHQLLTFTQVLPESDKEALLNYFFEWSDITPVTFTGKLSQVADIRYDHHQNGDYFRSIEGMLNNLLLILKRLNTLEYIGVKRENIVVKEEVLSKPKDRKGWSILD